MKSRHGAGNALAPAASDAPRGPLASSLASDLHDGPIQDVIALAQDVRLLGDQLAAVIASPRERKLVAGRLEDLQARLQALEASLRAVGRGATAAPEPGLPFAAQLRKRVREFEGRAGLRARLALEGELELLAREQRAALLGVVAEALANVRRHAQARSVEVTIAVHAGGLRASIYDDGRGFDVAKALGRAAREGHMGLALIEQRARQLGAKLEIESRPGGPTRVSVLAAY